jgi:HK97 gp10 family phage protein
MTTTVLGVPQTLAALERIQLEAKAATPVATQAAGQIVAAAMKAQAPRDTGRLAASIAVRRDGDDAIVGADVAYDRFVQKGTRYMEAQPYAEEASGETSDAVTAAIAAVFRVALR